MSIFTFIYKLLWDRSRRTYQKSMKRRRMKRWSLIQAFCGTVVCPICLCTVVTDFDPERSEVQLIFFDIGHLVVLTEDSVAVLSTLSWNNPIWLTWGKKEVVDSVVIVPHWDLPQECWSSWDYSKTPFFTLDIRRCLLCFMEDDLGWEILLLTISCELDPTTFLIHEGEL